MKKTWIITDTHFNHEMMQMHRPPDYEERIKKSLLMISKEDRLIHLGDICIGNDKEVHKFIKALPCQKILVRGNHDKKSYGWYEDNGWDFICEDMMMKFGGKRILFSHIPKKQEEGIDCNIHGHLHGDGERRIKHMVSTGHRREEAEAVGYSLDFHFDVAPDIRDYKAMELTRILQELDKWKLANLHNKKR